MKMLIILLTAACLQVGARGYGQISLSVKDESLQKVLLALKQQSGYQFFYNAAILGNAKPVTLSISNVSLQQALEQCFKEQPLLTYTIITGTVVIKDKQAANKEEHTPAKDLPPPIDIHGRITDETGKPVVGATVTVKGTLTATATNADGNFTLTGVDENAVLIISGVSIETLEISVNGKTDLGNIKTSQKLQREEMITIDPETGYQKIPKERATGSFVYIDNKLLNRSVGTNVLARLENVASGLLFNRGDNQPVGEALAIRGRSTIFSGSQPLVVVDNFVYDGDLRSINPNDVESVTLLKDAAAASIWGARSGNGVIVITTKRGSTGKPQVNFTSNVTFSQKPDLFSMHRISSNDYIGVEKFLFDKGYYRSAETNVAHPPLTPVVELLIAKRDGLISATEADKQIDALAQHDVRNDMGKYLYRQAVNQQYAVNVSGSAPYLNYYFSSGYDKNLYSLAGEDFNRLTFRSSNLFTISSRIKAEVSLNYAQSAQNRGNNPGYNMGAGGGKSMYPYAQLADAQGNPGTIVQNYRTSFVQQAMQQGLLDWTYNPIKDIYDNSNTSKVKDFAVNAGLHFQLLTSLNLELRYQYENVLNQTNSLHTDKSYYSRNIINQFTQVDPYDQSLTFPVPKGGIMDASNAATISHQGRVQLNYAKNWNGIHDLNMIAGWEIKNIQGTSDRYRLYGYNTDGSLVFPSINFVSFFQRYDNIFLTSKIDNPQSISGTLNRFLSEYANASYTYRNKYILSGSARKDGSNLFGVKTNQKFVPLWSAGAGWHISKEPFYHIDWLPKLKLRLTYGLQGNYSNETSAFTTISYDLQSSGLLAADIENPPNESLRWEKVATWNVGADFSLVNDIVSGSIEYYNKNANDLLGYAPVDPTTGLIYTGGGGSVYFGNTASLKGKGVDIQLNARIFDKKIKWYATLLYSYTSSTVTKYTMPISALGSAYLNEAFINPVIGKPVYSIYSYAWAGLDPQTGDPRGYIDGKVSNDYASIVANTSLDSMVYSGPLQPVTFGALLNNFTWNQFTFSFNISYKFGYYYRKPSVNYETLFSSWTGNSDFSKRWQKPGDEQNTSVPSMVYPTDQSRDMLYAFSSALVNKADNIRLEDIALSYEIDKGNWKQLPFRQVRISLYASNFGLLWSATKGIDPYYLNSPRQGINFSAGLNLTF